MSVPTFGIDARLLKQIYESLRHSEMCRHVRGSSHSCGNGERGCCSVCSCGIDDLREEIRALRELAEGSPVVAHVMGPDFPRRDVIAHVLGSAFPRLGWNMRGQRSWDKALQNAQVAVRELRRSATTERAKQIATYAIDNLEKV